MCELNGSKATSEAEMQGPWMGSRMIEVSVLLYSNTACCHYYAHLDLSVNIYVKESALRLNETKTI